MDDLKHMVIFYHVVDSDSFSAAARQLGIANSAISRQVSLLEQHVGVRLLNRTTRRMRLPGNWCYPGKVLKRTETGIPKSRKPR